MRIFLSMLPKACAHLCVQAFRCSKSSAQGSFLLSNGVMLTGAGKAMRQEAAAMGGSGSNKAADSKQCRMLLLHTWPQSNLLS